MTDLMYGMDPYYLDAMRRFEGFRPRPYWDRRQWSVGYGTQTPNPNETVDRAEAERRFGARVQDDLARVRALGVPMTPGQEAALVSLTYNAGPGWMQSGLGDAVRNGDWNRAGALLRQYNTSNGQVMPALTDRRNAELGWLNGAGVPMQQPTQVAANAPQPGQPMPPPMGLTGSASTNMGGGNVAAATNQRPNFFQSLLHSLNLFGNRDASNGPSGPNTPETPAPTPAANNWLRPPPPALGTNFAGGIGPQPVFGTFGTPGRDDYFEIPSNTFRRGGAVPMADGGISSDSQHEVERLRRQAEEIEGLSNAARTVLPAAGVMGLSAALSRALGRGPLGKAAGLAGIWGSWGLAGNKALHDTAEAYRLRQEADRIQNGLVAPGMEDRADGGNVRRPWTTSSTIGHLFPQDDGVTTDYLLSHGRQPFAGLGSGPDSPITQPEVDSIMRRYNLPSSMDTLRALEQVRRGLDRSGQQPPVIAPYQPLPPEEEDVGARARGGRTGYAEGGDPMPNVPDTSTWEQLGDDRYPVQQWQPPTIAGVDPLRLIARTPAGLAARAATQAAEHMAGPYGGSIFGWNRAATGPWHSNHLNDFLAQRATLTPEEVAGITKLRPMPRTPRPPMPREPLHERILQRTIDPMVDRFGLWPAVPIGLGVGYLADKLTGALEAVRRRHEYPDGFYANGGRAGYAEGGAPLVPGGLPPLPVPDLDELGPSVAPPHISAADAHEARRQRMIAMGMPDPDLSWADFNRRALGDWGARAQDVVPLAPEAMASYNALREGRPGEAALIGGSGALGLGAGLLAGPYVGRAIGALGRGLGRAYEALPSGTIPRALTAAGITGALTDSVSPQSTATTSDGLTAETRKRLEYLQRQSRRRDLSGPESTELRSINSMIADHLRDQRAAEQERERMRLQSQLGTEEAQAALTRRNYQQAVERAEQARNAELARDRRFSDTRVGHFFDAAGGMAPGLLGGIVGLISRAATGARGRPGLYNYGLPVTLGTAAGVTAANLPLVYNSLYTEPDNPQRRAYEAYARELPEGYPGRERWASYAASLPTANPVRQEAVAQLYDPKQLAERSILGAVEGALGGPTGAELWRIPGRLWGKLRGMPPSPRGPAPTTPLTPSEPPLLPGGGLPPLPPPEPPPLAPTPSAGRPRLSSRVRDAQENAPPAVAEPAPPANSNDPTSTLRPVQHSDGQWTWRNPLGRIARWHRETEPPKPPAKPPKGGNDNDGRKDGGAAKRALLKHKYADGGEMRVHRDEGGDVTNPPDIGDAEFNDLLRDADNRVPRFAASAHGLRMPPPPPPAPVSRGLPQIGQWGQWPMHLPREGYEDGGTPAADHGTVGWMRDALRDRAINGPSRADMLSQLSLALSMPGFGTMSRPGAIRGNDAVLANRYWNQAMRERPYALTGDITGGRPHPEGTEGALLNPRYGELNYAPTAESSTGLLARAILRHPEEYSTLFDRFQPAHSVWERSNPWRSNLPGNAANNNRPYAAEGPLARPSQPLEPDRANGGAVRKKRADGGHVAAGPIVGATPGRADAKPVSVNSGAYVLPADFVSFMGEGNTAAGHRLIERIFGPSEKMAAGGTVPIQISDGEHVLSPAQVARVGGGDHAKGCKVLDGLVKKGRALNIKRLQKLPGPAKA